MFQDDPPRMKGCAVAPSVLRTITNAQVRKGLFMFPSADYLEYRVKPGDSLPVLIGKFYGPRFQSAAYTAHLEQILALNPHVKNPDVIHAGTVLRLMLKPAPTPATSLLSIARATPRLSTTSSGLPHPVLSSLGLNQPPGAPMCRPWSQMLSDIPTQDELDFWMLSWLAENSNYLVVPGSIANGAFGNLLSPGNIALIEEIGDLYGQYKGGAITKGRYDYQRALRLNQLSQNIGPMERILFANQTPREAIRIARGGGVAATHNITSNANRLKQLASYGKSGGYVLGGVGIAASCMQIGDTNDRQEKNEIFVETVISTMAVVVAGVLVGAFLVSNPVGWGTALVLAVGSAASSYAAGRVARTAYSIHGNEVDFVSGMGLDAICR